VRVEIEQSEDLLRVELALDASPTAATIELLRDRVEATGGELVRRTGDANGHGQRLTLVWEGMVP